MEFNNGQSVCGAAREAYSKIAQDWADSGKLGVLLTSHPLPIYVDVRGSTMFQVLIVLVPACLGIPAAVHKIWKNKAEVVAVLSSSRAQAGIVACTVFVALYVSRSWWTRGAIIAAVAVAWCQWNSIMRLVARLRDWWHPHSVSVYSADEVHAALTHAASHCMVPQAAETRPDWLPEEGPEGGQLGVPPERWALTIGDVKKFLAAVRDTDKYRELVNKFGIVNMYHISDYFIIPWTKNRGSSVALLRNPTGLQVPTRSPK